MNNQLPDCCLPQKKRSLPQILAIIFSLFVLFIALDRFGLLVFSPGTKTLVGLGSVFVFGLAASLSSCTIFSAGILTALATQEKQRLEKQILFHLGRLIGFAGGGALIGFLGGKISLSSTGQNLLILAVSFMLFFTGLNILGLLPERLTKISIFQRIKNRIFSQADSSWRIMPFLFGAVTFFLPCGFTQSAQLYALSLANPFSSALVMLIFALGTLPALVGIGAAVSLSRGVWHNRIKLVAGVLTVLLGLSGFQNSLVLAGWSIPTSNNTVSSVKTEQQQIIEMTVYGDAYEPNVLRVKAGVPVLWKITGSNSMGCAQSLVSRSLGISADLQPGLNEFTFTPTKTGTYGFSCAMGMVRGTIVVE